MVYEWNAEKNKININKHGVSFDDAKEVFDDALHISVLDKRFNYYEQRWITLGTTKKGNLVVVAHLYIVNPEGQEIIRIISARKAANKERLHYEKH
jgi:hypothetical protein